ncbi:uncharacterized protein LOC119595018 [Penaeus monodon]|uniref:uncharacterized protein LOC119595018 n=1 Tax=Penaeus monodon TaxID=6687 RepID=UPI0018A7584C|nr:uncharacterized protein LOC119595018 [Penaeus monodon]
MNSALILLVAVGLSCLMAAQAASSFGVLAGLGALTSAVKRRYHGAGHGHGHGHGYKIPKRNPRPRFGRSVAAATEEDDDLIISAVGQLDPNACIPKMLCVLQAKDESDRTPRENMLVEILTSSTESPSSYNAAFAHAQDVATNTGDSFACKKFFYKCPFDDEELSELLDIAWSCNCNSGGTD